MTGLFFLKGMAEGLFCSRLQKGWLNLGREVLKILLEFDLKTIFQRFQLLSLSQKIKCHPVMKRIPGSIG